MLSLGVKVRLPLVGTDTTVNAVPLIGRIEISALVPPVLAQESSTESPWLMLVLLAVKLLITTAGGGGGGGGSVTVTVAVRERSPHELVAVSR